MRYLRDVNPESEYKNSIRKLRLCRSLIQGNGDTQLGRVSPFLPSKNGKSYNVPWKQYLG